jgi:CelD/BcsL family acetyltransferase involved in cellulose biosynthesis
VKVEWIEDPDEFAALAPEWDALLPAHAQPFDLHCWYRLWWESYGAPGQLAVCTVRREAELVGAFPLRRDGRRLCGFVNGESPETRPLARDPEALAALARATVAAAPAELHLRGLPRADPGTAALIAALGRRALTEPAHASPYVDTRGDFEAWRKANKKRWKAPLEQKQRKMARDHEAEFKPMEAVVDLEAELDEGLRIEAGGWKGEQGTAIESAPETTDFYRKVAREFERRGELRFSWIKLDGVGVAFDFCILFGNRLFTLKSAYDEEYRGLAPGLVRQLQEIERCFDSGIDTLELLGDEVGWKSRFASGNRPHLHLRGFPASPEGLARLWYRRRLRPVLVRLRNRIRGGDG